MNYEISLVGMMNSIQVHWSCVCVDTLVLWMCVLVEDKD